MPLEVLQNWVLIQLIVTPHILGKVQGQMKEVCRLIEPCLVIGTREYVSRLYDIFFPTDFFESNLPSVTAENDYRSHISGDANNRHG